MLDDKEKQVLVEQFRKLLDDPYLNLESSQHTSETNTGIDLVSLFNELAAIKTEIHLQRRQFKSALSLLVDDQGILRVQLEESHKQATDSAIHQQADIMQQLLLLRDRIEAGIELSSQYRRKRFSLISRSRERRFIQALCDGQRLTLKRLDQILNELHIKPIKALGRKFDSHTMNAVAISHDDEYDDGVVSHQIVQGYCWNDQVVRLAEVTVNRIESHVRDNSRN
jgi:molecular chaperone GrpE